MEFASRLASGRQIFWNPAVHTYRHGTFNRGYQRMELKRVKPYPGMIITGNTEFEGGVYDFTGKDGIVIGADNITVLGSGAHIKGGCEKEESTALCSTGESGHEDEDASSFGNGKEPGFYGIGISAEGRKGVMIKNLKVSGFDVGLHARDGRDFVIEGCDFSDCFTDPAWGWDDHGFHGGILFEHMHGCRIQGCRARNVWDALNMRFSDDNIVLDNDFSHTSDTGLKLWNSSRNEIAGNDFSYGIRIAPGEVHARDSSCVLIESGSNHNQFRRNDMTHGGDGLFIRVLNGWMSTGNLFEENDCSCANNNAIEAWADGNTYVRNKANHSSYGFWLGGSDNTVLIGNEVAYNGVLSKNAPEAFGNAGISVVNNSGSHYVVENNHIHNNHGPGIAIRYRKDYPSYHWVIQGNRIENNKTDGPYRGHGIYAKNARWLTFGKNIIEGNEGEAVFLDANTSDMVFLTGDAREEVDAAFTMLPESAGAGEKVVFKACVPEKAAGKLRFRWDLGDGTVETGECFEHIYKKEGFYRMGLTVDNGGRASIAFRNIYVLSSGHTFGTADQASNWTCSGNAGTYEITKDMAHTVAGQGSICIKAGNGTEHTLVYPATGEMGLDIGALSVFSFYLRYLTESEPDWERRSRMPVITLYADDENHIRLIPAKGIMERYFLSNNEEKDNWQFVSIDISGENGWERHIAGNGLEGGVINRICIEYGNVYPGISRLWLDAMRLSEKEKKPLNALNLALNKYASGYPSPICFSSAAHSDVFAPLAGNTRLYGDGTSRYASGAAEEEAFYGIDFGSVRKFDRADVYFYHNLSETVNAKSESVPLEAWLEAETGDKWEEIPAARIRPVPGQNVFVFKPVLASNVRVRFRCDTGRIASIYSFSVYNTQNVINQKNRGVNAEITSNRKNMLTVDAFEVKLNKEINSNGAPLGDLTARVFELDGSGSLAACLFKKVVPRDDIVPYAVTRIEAGLSGLESGKKYALALGQSSLAESRTVGDYYRWIAGKTDFGETFAIYDKGETKPADYDWGTAYLRVLCGGITADYSNESEHIGVRFGIRDMECRYMTFTIPDPVLALTDGAAGGEAGWTAEGKDAEVYITFADDVCINGANLWIDGDKPGSIELLCKGKVLASVEEPETGFVRLGFGLVKEKEFTLRINCTSGKCAVRELELESEPAAASIHA